jgi:hypothetical protein
MGDLLKEALAEAKLVKKVSVEAAREQLNEALTPRIESMLSKKLNAEIAENEDFDEDDIQENEDFDEDDELQETEDPGNVTDKFDKKDQDVTPALSETEDPGSVTDIEDKDDQDVTPELTEEDEMEKAEDEAGPEEETEDDLEIESILRELEDGSEEEKEEEEQMATEQDELGIENDEEEIPVEAIEDDEKIEEEDEIPVEDDEEEEINVEALLSKIDEEEYPGESDSEDKDSEQQNVVKQLESKNAALRKRLSEYVKAVKTLKAELNEVNLLNTKLYFTTKMFKKFNVSNPTKIKIIETFDRANSVREIKLIYATLHESLKNGAGAPNKPARKITSIRDIKENVRSSSKAVITDRYEIKEAILSEGEDLKNRWKKLSGQSK